MAEGARFELADDTRPSTAFEAAAFNHSATLPVDSPIDFVPMLNTFTGACQSCSRLISRSPDNAGRCSIDVLPGLKSVVLFSITDSICPPIRQKTS